MTRVKKKKAIFLIGLICTIIFTSISQYSQISSTKNYIASPKTAQIDYDYESLTIPRSFFLKKYAENKDSKENITSIDIELPDTTWNITDLELNFTDIKIERELKTIEGNFTGTFKTIHKLPPIKTFGLSVQLNIQKNTTIYGLYIFGYTIQGITPEPIKVQIQRFDNINHIPDGYTYKSQELNISTTPGWYFQNFSSDPIPLQKGNYSLVLNGTNIISPSTYYYWAYNGLTPIHPELYTSNYDGNNWIDVAQNSPLLYKLYEKTDTYYNPKELNMIVEVDGEEHEVIDGLEDYTGRAIISNKNFNPNDINLHIPIKINKTIILNFSLDYRIKIFENFISGGSLLIKENSMENLWTINPIINRLNDENFSVIFEFHNNWKHLRVHKNYVNLTKGIDYVISGNTLTILNDTIPYGTNFWEITANSTKIQVKLDVQQDSWTAGQLLEFRLKDPVKAGNYSYILYDKNKNFKKYWFYVNPDKETLFNYSISSNPVNGYWKAFVYWNNETDAGVQTQPFQITGGITIIPTPGTSGDDSNDNGEASEDITPIIILAIVLIGGITSAVSISSYEGFKRLKKIRDKYRTKLLNQFKDLMNLNYIMITEKKSGLNIFEKYIAGQEIDATLISGFLNAIQAFGIELTKSNDQSQTISLEYKDSKVLMSEFKSFRIILIMKERPSEQMINSITDLSYSIENKYSEILGHFKGNIVQFTGISDLIEEYIHTSFISPLKVVEQIDAKLSIGERAMINKAKELMKEYNLNYFHSTYLISEQNFKPSDVENILNLINKKIFQPTSSDSAGIKKIK